jgi:hypothetical protein
MNPAGAASGRPAEAGTTNADATGMDGLALEAKPRNPVAGFDADGALEHSIRLLAPRRT